jgi:Protein of unknown function (DUF2857)
MLALLDPQVRLVLLQHVAVRLANAEPEDVTQAGLAESQLAHLGKLSAVDLNRLAGMRQLTIAVSLDGAALQTGLRLVEMVNEVKALENHFIRHGASTALMSTVFKIRRKLTLQRRRELGVKRPSGRVALPDPSVRERIYRVWRGIADPSLRVRYFQLHQTFPHLPIAVLEAVVREYERLA